MSVGFKSGEHQFSPNNYQYGITTKGYKNLYHDHQNKMCRYFIRIFLSTNSLREYMDINLGNM